MNIKELKEQFETGTFYHTCNGTVVKVPVKKIDIKLNSMTIRLEHDGVIFDITIDQVKKVKRPSNTIAEYSWCYLIQNDDFNTIGYIGQIK